jgi:hypothetical protein
MKRPFSCSLGGCVGALILIGIAPAHAQSTASRPVTLKVTATDVEAASAATRVHRHARTAIEVGTATGEGKEALSAAQKQAAANATAPSSAPGSDVRVRYPGDLHYFGGPTVQTAQFHDIYVNPSVACPAPACWGNPEKFLHDLGRSDFIHVTDQYTFLSSNNRYTLGTTYMTSYPSPAPNPAYTDNDMLAIAHAAAVTSGQSGYGHIYHIYLTPGTDECFDNTFSVCYSPDNANTWFFCAYHGSADFPDVGHILYSVEPYQNIAHCWVEAGTPNGRLIDSTNDVLSHETIETITDPDGTGWWQYYGLGMRGQEIGDECVFLTNVGDHSSAPFIYRMSGRLYATQPEYDNSAHGCTVGSSD